MDSDWLKNFDTWASSDLEVQGLCECAIGALLHREASKNTPHWPNKFPSHPARPRVKGERKKISRCIQEGHRHTIYKAVTKFNSGWRKERLSKYLNKPLKRTLRASQEQFNQVSLSREGRESRNKWKTHTITVLLSQLTTHLTTINIHRRNAAA